MWTDRFSLLRILIRGTVLLVLVALMLAPTLAAQSTALSNLGHGRRRFGEFMLNTWSRWLCRCFGVSVQVSGEACPGPVLIVANHISWLDIVAMHGAATMSFVSKAEVRRWPVIGFAATMGGTVYLERGSHDSSSTVAGDLVERLVQGRRVAIFPEGGIRPGDDVKVFHARLFRIAIETGSPVQPVMIRYVRDGRRDPDMSFFANENFVVNMLRLLGRPRSTCDLRFLEPVSSQGQSRRQLARRCQEAVSGAFAEAAYDE